MYLFPCLSKQTQKLDLKHSGEKAPLLRDPSAASQECREAAFQSQIEPVWIKLRLWFGEKCLHPKMFRVPGSQVCSFSKLYPSISAPRECPIILAGGQHIS